MKKYQRGHIEVDYGPVKPGALLWVGTLICGIGFILFGVTVGWLPALALLLAMWGYRLQSEGMEEKRRSAAGVGDRMLASDHPALKPCDDPATGAAFAEAMDQGKGAAGAMASDAPSQIEAAARAYVRACRKETSDGVLNAKLQALFAAVDAAGVVEVGRA